MDIDVRNDVLIELSDDYVQLWSIIDRIKDINIELDSVSIRRKTLNFIREMLDEQLMLAGNFNEESEFEIWHISSLEVVKIIEKEWMKLGREPNIGEIVWFDCTQKGEQEVRLLNL